MKQKTQAKSSKTLEAPKKSKKAKSKAPWVILVTLTVALAVMIGGYVGWLLSRPKPKMVPRLDLSLSEVTMEEVALGKKDTRYYGNTLTVTDGEEVTKYDNVELKGRGNSTWGQIKKPYQIKLDEKADLLGLGRAKKWVLLANYFDVSFLRTDVAFKLEQMLGEKYALKGEFVELYVDQNYYGLYYLSHKVNISKDEMNLRDQLGVVMELDNLHYDTGGTTSNNGDYLVAKDAVDEDKAAEASAGFMAAYNNLEKAVKARDFAAAQKYADVESFAIYYLLSEFTNNPDAYASSFFMYKDGPLDVIHAGPGWDFDFALANRGWAEEPTPDFYDPEYLHGATDRVYGTKYLNENDELVDTVLDTRMTRLVLEMAKMPEFQTEVERIWQERMHGRGGELIGYIGAQIQYISEAAARDEARWKYNAFCEEAAHLIEWVAERYEAFEEKFGPQGDLKSFLNGDLSREGNFHNA